MVTSGVCAFVHLDVEPRVYRSKEAANYLHISQWQLRQMVHSGEMKYIQRVAKGPWMFDKRDLDAWIDKNKQQEPTL